MVTKDSAEYVERLLAALRSFADEIVVAVDSSSTDSTEEICGRYADRLFRIEPIGLAAPAYSWLHRQCTGDWVLRVDDDEMLSVKFVEALPGLMADREVTHYWTRIRWVFGDGRWISQHPWWPDWKLRLLRNIPSIFHVPPVVHTRVHVWGAARYFYEGSLYHYDLAYHSEEWRRRKVEQRYESRAPGKGLRHFYLPEEILPETSPIPEDDPPLEVPVRSNRRGLLNRSVRRKHPPVEEVSLEEIRLAAMSEREPGPELFRARVECLECPRTMRAGEWYPVDVRIRNESSTIWPLSGLGSPVVRLGYHWLSPEREARVYGGHRTDLPHTLPPSEAACMPAPVLAPEEPGSYILQWDPVVENVAWFSTQGWTGPEVEIQVMAT